MSLDSKKQTATKFYQHDVVVTKSDGLGIVLRCWHDAEDVSLSDSSQDPLMRPLERGEVGVSFLSDPSKREILHESDLTLLDRTLQAGDFCKRSVDDVQSGVVLDCRTTGRLQHVISGEFIEGWRSSAELQTNRDAEIGDYIIYDDWLGQVIEVYDENIIEVPSGQLVRLPEFSSRLSVGEKSENILPTPARGVQNLNVLGFLFGSNRTGVETVVAVKHTVYAIAWLALNQTLDKSEAQTRQRPQRLWHGADIGKLTLIRDRSDFQMRINERVTFKDNTGLPFTKHGREGEAGGVVVVNTFKPVSVKTELDILWQDGSKETLCSVDVIPYLNQDEYDCWPGDHVFWSSEGEKRTAVVQSVNAVERTATVLFPDKGEVELVSLLELDPHGTSDSGPYSGPDGLGVRRGDTVFIHAEGETNGFEKPRVPRIGELEAWVRENPFVGTQPGQLGGWRKELAELGSLIATRRGTEGSEEGVMTCSPESLRWMGEVTDLHPDGSIEVLHPDETTQRYPLDMITKLYDGIEQLEDELYAGSQWGSDVDDEDFWDKLDKLPPWDIDTMNLGSFDSEPEGDDAEEEPSHDYTDESEEEEGIDLIRIIDPQASVPESPPLSAGALSSEPSTSASPDGGGGAIFALESQGQTVPDDVDAEEEQDEAEDDDDDDDDETQDWKRFKILSSAPTDHAYYHTTTPTQPTKQFMSRLNREYRILMGSLPENILVRAYEDRLDLLRVLIIGPQHTPYEDAPFLIDWMLDSNFPNSPPLAHFLSWTNGNGRVNPNLYEEGKVCLSILGTWAGDRDEIWSASRSSLLQAFVSIQGLVLVKEPWFCEPAYEKLRGTEEGTVNSRLYSEKAYVLSRGFVRRALEIPPGSLESELKWLYYSDHRLEKVLLNCRALIEKSRGSPSDVPDEYAPIPKLTAGGIIALERTLVKLQGLLDSHDS